MRAATGAQPEGPAAPPASCRCSALAEDHINDVASNLGAMLAAGIVKFWPAGWWVDPVAAIAIALVILARWTVITHTQVGLLAGC